MSTKILFVDDDENILAAYQRRLRKQFSIDTAASGLLGLAKLNTDGPYAVTVADMQMPSMNGVEFLKQVERTAPDTVRLMLTGNADQKTATDAVNQGHVFRFLTKPCPPETMELTLQAALRQHHLIIAERELLERTLNGAIKVLVDVLAAVDPGSFGRGSQLREHMHDFLESFHVPNAWELELAAMLSPIGRVTLPPAVLLKHRAKLTLTRDEEEMLQRVPQIGATLLEKIPRLERIAQIVRWQNKHFDGSGFPANSPGGDEIPIGARILKVLGDLESLRAGGASIAGALLRMHQSHGQYDPQVLSAVSRRFDVALADARSEMPQLVSADVNNLQPGQVLGEDVKTADGLVVVVADAILSPLSIERLRNFRALGTISRSVLVRFVE